MMTAGPFSLLSIAVLLRSTGYCTTSRGHFDLMADTIANLTSSKGEDATREIEEVAQFIAENKQKIAEKVKEEQAELYEKSKEKIGKQGAQKLHPKLLPSEAPSIGDINAALGLNEILVNGDLLLSFSHIGVLSDAPVCVDIAPEEYCSMNRQFCDDPYLSKELLEKCAKTCQVCGGTKPAEPCVDKIPVCDLTITHCWDPEKIDYFSENCAKTCKFCTEPTTTTAPTTAYPTTTSSLCISGAMYDDCGVGVGVDHNPECIDKASPETCAKNIPFCHNSTYYPTLEQYGETNDNNIHHKKTSHRDHQYYKKDHATNHFHDASKNDFPTHYNSKLQRQRLLALLLQDNELKVDIADTRQEITNSNSMGDVKWNELIEEADKVLMAIRDLVNDLEDEVYNMRTSPKSVVKGGNAFGSEIAPRLPQLSLPVFTGKAWDWPNFYASFKERVQLVEQFKATLKEMKDSMNSGNENHKRLNAEIRTPREKKQSKNKSAAKNNEERSNVLRAEYEAKDQLQFKERIKVFEQETKKNMSTQRNRNLGTAGSCDTSVGQSSGKGSICSRLSIVKTRKPDHRAPKRRSEEASAGKPHILLKKAAKGGRKEDTKPPDKAGPGAVNRLKSVPKQAKKHKNRIDARNNADFEKELEHKQDDGSSEQ
ncbi:hypothetical protein QR680_013911 [Steinernema hermaphroditum]|uniref:ShKT domain-containing protein n=1 Tax=Steinernema hermaphroditum TaxID=289476 RepID=A0AA39M362_9BILA|nr:hypothetical protein QR680_013911 [Steinernema hermaphroditum]